MSYMVVYRLSTYVAPAINTSPVFALVRIESIVMRKAEEITITTILIATPSIALMTITGTRRIMTTRDAISDRVIRLRADPEKM